jgi:Phage integrase, N-terminal SAM-like domain
MPTTTDSRVALRHDVFAPNEELALAGFLAGYSGLTREAYMLDLRQYVAWCAERRIALFGARRADIEAFGRRLEMAGRARATISRRLCTIAACARLTLTSVAKLGSRASAKTAILTRMSPLSCHGPGARCLQ